MKALSKMISFTLVRDGEDGENGKDGKPGPSLVYAGAWKEDITYIKDDVINHYVHQVRNGNKEFYLLQTPQSLGDDPYLNNTQGSGNIWRRVEQHDLILARKIQADEIDVDSLVVRHVKTANIGPRITMSGSEIKVYGTSEHPNIIFGVDANGYAVLSYYSMEGALLYDLGPRGIDWNSIEPSKWNTVEYAFLTKFKIKWSDVSRALTMTSELNETYYKWYAGSNPTITEEDREKEKYIRLDSYHDAGIIEDGWYIIAKPASSPRPLYFSQNTGNWIKPEKKAVYPTSEGIKDSGFIYYEKMYQMKDGQLVDEWYIMWNGDKNGNQIWP